MRRGTTLKILVVNTLYYPYQVGGAEKSVQEIVEYLAKGNNVSVLTLKNKTDSHIPGSEIVSGVQVSRIKFLLRYWPFPKKDRSAISKSIWHFLDLVNIPILFRIFQLQISKKPDIVMTHNLTGFSISPWIASKMLGIPVLHLLHDYNLLCPKTTMRQNATNCESICGPCKPRLTLSRIAPKPAAFVGVSEFIVNRHRNFLNFPAGTVFGVAHGSASFTPIPRSLQNFDYGFLGGLNEVKGIDVYIEAAKKLPHKSFAIAGKPDPEFLEKISNIPNIHFLGWTNAIEFYSCVKVLVVPSVWNDPAPRVILEARRSGLPVVISEMPTLVEIAQYNQCVYFTFEPGNADSLVEVLENLDENMSIPQAKSFPSQGEQIEPILDEILNKRKLRIKK